MAKTSAETKRLRTGILLNAKEELEKSGLKVHHNVKGRQLVITDSFGVKWFFWSSGAWYNPKTKQRGKAGVYELNYEITSWLGPRVLYGNESAESTDKAKIIKSSTLGEVSIMPNGKIEAGLSNKVYEKPKPFFDPLGLFVLAIIVVVIISFFWLR